jgi:hypothetical protein
MDRFWFAGLAGMLLESETIRRVLGSSVGGRGAKQPASYAFSFNPLPALVIAVVRYLHLPVLAPIALQTLDSDSPPYSQ